MIRNLVRTMMFVVLASAAVPGWSGFQVADLVYVPVVSNGTGANESVWRSDVIFFNADDANIDVAVVFLPSGVSSNANRFRDRTTWLGGRESDGFGIVEASLADIPPNGTVVIEDIVGLGRQHQDEQPRQQRAGQQRLPSATLAPGRGPRARRPRRVTRSSPERRGGGPGQAFRAEMGGTGPPPELAGGGRGFALVRFAQCISYQLSNGL